MTDRSMKKIGKVADRVEDRAEPIGDFEFPIEMTEVGRSSSSPDASDQPMPMQPMVARHERPQELS